MEHNKENTTILLYEEDPMFRNFLIAFIQAMGYPHLASLGATKDVAEHLAKHPGPSVCLIGLNTGTPQQNGLILAQQIREQTSFVSIIFLAQLYNEEVYATCRPLLPSAFINKELSDFKLKLALEQAFLHHYNETAPYPGKPAPSLSEPLFLKAPSGFIAIPEQQILYFSNHTKTTRAHTLGQTYDTQVHLHMLETSLHKSFVRIHKSYLVNISHIEAIHPNESGVIIGNEILPIGHAFRKAFFNRIKLLR